MRKEIVMQWCSCVWVGNHDGSCRIINIAIMHSGSNLKESLTRKSKQTNKQTKTNKQTNKQKTLVLIHNYFPHFAWWQYFNENEFKFQKDCHKQILANHCSSWKFDNV